MTWGMHTMGYHYTISFGTAFFSIVKLCFRLFGGRRYGCYTRNRVFGLGDFFLSFFACRFVLLLLGTFRFGCLPVLFFSTIGVGRE